MGYLDNNFASFNSDANNENNIPFKMGEINMFGNTFGMIPNRYIKYFNLISLHIISTFIFTTIYYILFLNFNDNFFTDLKWLKTQILNDRWFAAFVISVNFQTTTAYVDIKFKSRLARFVTVIQLLTTFLITFLFLI